MKLFAFLAPYKLSPLESDTLKVCLFDALKLANHQLSVLDEPSDEYRLIDCKRQRIHQLLTKFDLTYDN